MRIRLCGLVLSSLLAITGCANLNTISRSTSLPKNGKVVHLDIQQRLLIANAAGAYCAEPSPDGLAAFAAALGVSASNPASQALSVSGSGNSNAASIGLRSQTITVMRDAMYRVCEAYNNGYVGVAQVPTLMGRSQDLTAVILAVEQLTGPVTAQQVALTATTDASAAASLVAIAEQLELALKQVERANERLEAGVADANKTKTAILTVDGEIQLREVAKGNLDSTTQATEIAKLEGEIATLKQDKQRFESRLGSEQQTVELRKSALASAEATRDAIQAKQDTAFASATSGTAGNSSFGGQTVSSPLSKEATIEVAGVVKDMVIEVLNKSYMEDSCLSVLTIKVELDAYGRDPLGSVRKQCLTFVEATVAQRVAAAEALAAKSELEAAQIEAQTKSLRTQTKSSLDKLISCVAPNGAIDSGVLSAILDQASSDGLADGIRQNVERQNSVVALREYLASSPGLFGRLLTTAANADICPELDGN